MADRPTGPLAGLLVADFSRILAGPYATMLLADLGAEVVKVEGRRRGRHPHLAAAGARRGLDLLPRGQPQQAVDRARPQGRRRRQARPGPGRPRRRADRELPARRAGPLRPRTTTTVAAANPGIVYASISGFGTTEAGAVLPGLRPDRAGDLRADEPDRRPRRRALPRRHLGLRRDGRAARDHRRPRRAATRGTRPAAASTSRSTCWPRRSPVWSTSRARTSPAASSRSGWATATRACSPTSRCRAADGELIITAGNNGAVPQAGRGARRARARRRPAVRPQRGPHRQPRRAPAAAGRAAADPTTMEWFRDIIAAGVPCGPINTIDGGRRVRRGDRPRPGRDGRRGRRDGPVGAEPDHVLRDAGGLPAARPRPSTSTAPRSARWLARRGHELETAPDFPTSLGTSTADEIRLLGQDLPPT